MALGDMMQRLGSGLADFFQIPNGETGDPLIQKADGSKYFGTVKGAGVPFAIDTSGVVSPPATGKIRYNNATQASATELYISYTDQQGDDVTGYADNFAVGDMLYLQHPSDVAIFQWWRITTSAADTGFHVYGVALEFSSGGDIASDQKVIVMRRATPAAVRPRSTADSTGPTDTAASISTPGGVSVAKSGYFGEGVTVDTNAQLGESADDDLPLYASRSRHVNGASENRLSISARRHTTGAAQAWFNTSTRVSASIDGAADAQSWIEFRHYTTTVDNAICFGEGASSASPWMTIRNGKVNIEDATDSTGPTDTAASFSTNGGLSVAQNIFAGGLTVESTGEAQVKVDHATQGIGYLFRGPVSWGLYDLQNSRFLLNNNYETNLTVMSCKVNIDNATDSTGPTDSSASFSANGGISVVKSGYFGDFVATRGVYDSTTVNALHLASFDAAADLSTGGKRSRVFRVLDRAFIDYEQISGGYGKLIFGSDFAGIRNDGVTMDFQTGITQLANPRSTHNMLVGGTTESGGGSGGVWGAHSVIGKDGTDKIIMGYLASSTNEPTIGGHDSGLGAWAPINLIGTTVSLRNAEGAAALQVEGGAVKIGSNEATIAADGASLELNGANAVSSTFIDLHAGPTYTDYAARLIRNATDNGALELVQRGTGAIQLISLESAPIVFSTNNAQRMIINADGTIQMLGLPTSSAGLASNTVWNDGGTLKIVP